MLRSEQEKFKAKALRSRKHLTLLQGGKKSCVTHEYKVEIARFPLKEMKLSPDAPDRETRQRLRIRVFRSIEDLLPPPPARD